MTDAPPRAVQAETAYHPGDLLIVRDRVLIRKEGHTHGDRMD